MLGIKKSASIHFLREGKPATSYWLVPSATSVRYNPDTGVWSPSSVSCARMQQTGSGLPESSTYGALVAQYLDANGSILTQSSISNGQAASFGRYGQHQVPIMAIRFIWQASSQLASVTVQAITDGTEGPQGPQGNPGENGIGVTITPSTVTYDPAKGSQTVNVVVIVNDGELAGPPDELSKLYTSSDMSAAVNESVTLASGKWSYDKAIDAWQGRYTLYFSSVSTLEQSLWFNVTKNGVTVKCCLPVSRLQRGEPGPQGAIAVSWKWDDIVRNGGLPGGRQFENGSEGCTYLDSVLVGEAQYRCVTSHAYEVNENPQTDSRWEMYSIQYNSVATDLLLARMASINFLAGNTLSILNADNDVVARLQAGSGIFPVLYIAPVRKPVSVDFYYAVSTSSNPISISWLVPTPGAAISFGSSSHLHLRYIVHFSDGSSEEQVRKDVVQGVTSDIAFLYNDYFAADSSANVNHERAIRNNPGCTNEQKPELHVKSVFRESAGNSRFNPGPYFLGRWSRDNSNYGQNALLKLYSNGSAFFGSEGGSSISINPETAEIIFASEKGSLIIDSKEHTKLSDFLSDNNSETHKSSNYDSGNLNALTARATSQAPVRSTLVSFSTTDPCTAKITIYYRVWLVAGTRGTSGFQPVQAQGSGYVTLDGEVVAGEARVTANAGETKYTETMQVVVTRSLAPGTHKLEAVAALLSGYSGGNVDCDARAMVEISYQQQVCRYFGNGFAIGSTTSNYCMAYNNSSGVMCLDFRNSSGYGLKIDSTGVFAVGPGDTTKNLLT